MTVVIFENSVIYVVISNNLNVGYEPINFIIIKENYENLRRNFKVFLIKIKLKLIEDLNFENSLVKIDMSSIDHVAFESNKGAIYIFIHI